jgi:hypothetical protein
VYVLIVDDASLVIVALSLPLSLTARHLVAFFDISRADFVICFYQITDFHSSLSLKRC